MYILYIYIYILTHAHTAPTTCAITHDANAYGCLHEGWMVNTDSSECCWPCGCNGQADSSRCPS